MLKKFLMLLFLGLPFLMWAHIGMAEKPDSAICRMETINGNVVAVQDVNNITNFNDAQHEIKNTLAEIDAPELKQPYGDKAEQMLSDLILDKDVTVIRTRDKQGRAVGRVYQGA